MPLLKKGIDILGNSLGCLRNKLTKIFGSLFSKLQLFFNIIIRFQALEIELS